MRILMLTGGSRGDVEPFTALARAAAARGHTVRLGAPDNSGADLSGIDVVSLQIDFTALVSPTNQSPVGAVKDLRDSIRPAMRRFLTTAVNSALAWEPDLIVYHPKVLTAPFAADAIGVPHVLVEPVPSITPTRVFPAPGIASANLGPLNRVSYRVVKGAGMLFRREVDAARTLLPPTQHRHASAPTATVIPISPHLLERPSDWPESVHLTGDWRWDASTQAREPVLERFITGGAYLYAGFGSMVAGDPEARAVTVIDSARRAGLRVLAVEGWGGLRVPETHRGDDVHVASAVSHGDVLDRATVAIHHGGAGTVHAVVRSSTPSIVVPFLADQPFWGRTLHALRLAPAPIRSKKLSGRRLDDALARSSSCQAEADRVGDLVRSDRGVERALDILESLGR